MEEWNLKKRREKKKEEKEKMRKCLGSKKENGRVTTQQPNANLKDAAVDGTYPSDGSLPQHHHWFLCHGYSDVL
jgi:hypothetical protein